MAAVTIEGLSKQYQGGAEWAVKDVSFTVADGEFMVVLGPSGCGKSSVLRMIAGLEPVTSGNVLIDGQLMNRVPAKDRDIAMVFQSYALYPHMNVYNNLAFGLRRRGVDRVELDLRVHDAAKKLGLEPFLDRKPHALSGGQRQRVALGRAIVRKPKVFLFDEPLSNLDAALRVSTRNELIRQQRELTTTTIYVTHDQVEAMTMGDRMCIMNKGEIAQIGSPLELYRNPANIFVARFLGSPPMNLAEGRLLLEGPVPVLALGGATVPLRDWTRASLAALQDLDVIVGVRPEDLYETPGEVRGGAPVPLDVQVEAIEHLGSETILTLASGVQRQQLIARVGRMANARVGDCAQIVLDAGALHIFEKSSGRACPKAPSQSGPEGGSR
jgi:multiple sugar transport system ATP-binding protein